jgi:RND family efflux transporter MFP subunit
VTQTTQPSYWKWLALAGVVVLGLVAGAWQLVRSGASTAKANDDPQIAQRPKAGGRRVQVVLPTKGEMDRTSTQPGSVRAFESVQLYAEASGYLKTLNVDIGDSVKKGQVLAEVAVPDLRKQVDQYRAAVKQAKARVDQMTAGIASALADVEAARAAVPQAEALAKSKAAELRFREQQLKRMRDLLALRSVDERLVDEKTEQRDAAREAQIGAQEGVRSAKAQVTAMDAKVAKAHADKAEAEAEVDVTKALLEKAEVQVEFATIKAPFDGLITERNYFRNDFVRSANESGTHLPLLTVQRTDRFRVVVQIPDRDVPFARPGEAATVEMDALPGEQFPGTLARVSRSEDPQTRLMHVEIDLLNPKGKIADGMYGRVTIILEKSNMLAVPPSCLVGTVHEGKGKVFVVRDGRAHLVTIQVGANTGVRLGIVSGLKPSDRVIVQPDSSIEDGMAVTPSEVIAHPGALPDH